MSTIMKMVLNTASDEGNLRPYSVLSSRSSVFNEASGVKAQ